MVLYWGSGSTPAWRVQLALAMKGLSYESRLLSFSGRDTRKPEFLAINPRGKVPTLIDGDVVVNESLAILAYLDRKFPEPPLFGQTAAETGDVWRHVMEYESHGAPAFTALSRAVFAATPDAAKAREAVPEVVAELDRLAPRVARGALVGSALSAADIVWYCGFQQVVRAATRPAAADMDLGVYPVGGRWPALVPWARRIEAIPGFLQTYPPHWLEGAHPSPTALA
jgi:glutathione S-transferase